MDDTAYLRQRTNDILRERIALGMTGAGYAPKRCSRGYHKRCAKGKGEGVLVGGKCSRKQTKVKAYCRKRKGAGCEMCHMCQGQGVLVGGEGYRRKRRTRKHRAAGDGDGYMYEGMGEGEGYRRKTRRHRAAGYDEDMGGYGTKMGAKHSPWIKHVKKYMKDHDVSYKEALIKASRTY